MEGESGVGSGTLEARWFERAREVRSGGVEVDGSGSDMTGGSTIILEFDDPGM